MSPVWESLTSFGERTYRRARRRVRRLRRRIFGAAEGLYYSSEEDCYEEDSNETKTTDQLEDEFGRQDFREMGRKLDEEAAVDSDIFTLSVGMVVLVNLASIAVETDLDSTSSYLQFFSYINGMFLLVYVGEILLRLLTHGPDAMRDQLTILDIAVVTISFIERYMQNSGFARALPALRLFRLLRLLHTTNALKSERELWILVVSGNHTILTVSWMCVFLLFILIASASFAEHVIGESAQWVGTMDPSVDHDPFEALDSHQYFGSTSRSFLTMLQVATLSQWADITRRVVFVYPILSLFFFGFIGATAYGITLVVISNIVEDCLRAARQAEAITQAAAKEKNERIGDKVAYILHNADKDGDGEIFAKEINRALAKTDLRCHLDELMVPQLDGNEIIRFFDRVGLGRAQIDDIVAGVLTMDEDIKPSDYVKLNMWVSNLLMRTMTLGKKSSELAKQVDALRNMLVKAFEALEYFHRTKEVSELRGRALAEIRSAPQAELPKLREWRPPRTFKKPIDSEASILVGFASRFIGPKAPPDAEDDPHSSGPNLPGQVVSDDNINNNNNNSSNTNNSNNNSNSSNKKNKSIALSAVRVADLPPAPPRMLVAQQLAAREQQVQRDRYELVHDPNRGLVPNPRLTNLRELLR